MAEAAAAAAAAAGEPVEAVGLNGDQWAAKKATRLAIAQAGY